MAMSTTKLLRNVRPMVRPALWAVDCREPLGRAALAAREAGLEALAVLVRAFDWRCFPLREPALPWPGFRGAFGASSTQQP